MNGYTIFNLEMRTNGFSIYLSRQVSLMQKIRLTPIKQQIIAMLCKGYSAKVIARELGKSPRTIEMHIEHMYRACNVHSRSDFLDLIHSDVYKDFFKTS